MIKRVFLIDPMCVLDFGHNPKSLLYFSDYFASAGYEPIPVVCRYFPLLTGEYAKFERRFDYYYQQFVPIKTAPAPPPKGSGDCLDPLEALSFAEFSQWLDDDAIGADDHLFYPSVDFYGVCGLLRALIARGAQNIPRIHLRFIGVMENATRSTNKPLAHIGKLLESLGQTDRVTLSAESPVYSDNLRDTFKREVGWTLYPLESAPAPLPATGSYRVFSAGAGRGDKGFFRLLNIARLYAKTYPKDNVQFVVQNVPVAEERHQTHYVSQLYAAPNIDLLPARLSDDELEAQYARCSFLIMPYDYETYRFRGSAVFMEGVAKHRPFAIASGTGFHPLVTQLEAAFNCPGDEDFVHTIRRFSQMTVSDVAPLTDRTAARYAELARTQMASVWTEVSA
ncbi:hypothetical protein ASD79_00960 [Caulobacter sp. Root655]|uniref:glycosyltransferase n=1 Tax=Caulobacter sp. Root655 TaxID=1736578 RepID=UPI0006F312DA|nr:glycosyltransferase [Caulobacter sp. Root655]KRA65885.1 hypothetical protein ASD79_00960 [Caulobacter sp. Root655]